MPIDVQETGTLSRVAAVVVPAEEYRREMTKSLKQLSSRVSVKGFRKGHIPMSVMRQRYSQSVAPDVVENLVQKYVEDVIQQHENVLFLGRPQIQELPLKDADELKFTIELELRPQIDPIGYMGLEVEKPDTSVDDAAVDSELERLREQNARLELVEGRSVIESGDTVVADFVFVGDHPELEEFKGEDTPFEVGNANVLPGITEALIGAEFGAVVEPKITLPENFPIEELREQEVTLRLTVKEVKHRVLPELDDAFAKTLELGETLEELRERVHTDLQEAREHEAMHLAEDSLMQALLAQNEFELPPLFVENQLDYAVRQRLQMFQQQGLDIAQLGLDVSAFKDTMREETITNIRGELLLMAIAEKEEMKVEEADMKAYFEHRALHANVPARQLEAFMRQDQERWQQSVTLALLEKVRQFLLKEATIKTVEWPAADAGFGAEMEEDAGEEASADASEETSE